MPLVGIAGRGERLLLASRQQLPRGEARIAPPPGLTWLGMSIRLWLKPVLSGPLVCGAPGEDRCVGPVNPPAPPGVLLHPETKATAREWDPKHRALRGKTW